MQTLEYNDPIEGFRGWLAYDGTSCRLAAGGCRVQPGLSADHVQILATRMTLKQRLLGSNVDDAKCGIDYDPRSAGKVAALTRFLMFLRQELLTRFSMGCDMGTQYEELDALVRPLGVPSIKYAIAHAQELGEAEYFARAALLTQPVGSLSLGQRRAGHALAQAAIIAAKCRSGGRRGRISCVLQGFGNLGRAAAYTLAEAGIAITAICDEYGYVYDSRGLDMMRLLESSYGTPVNRLAPVARSGRPEALFDLDADMFVLAAGEDSISVAQATRLQAPTVVVGSNCGLSPEAELALHRHGVLVIPDFVGGIGGSASMEALFGSVERPSPAEVLAGVSRIMQLLVERIVDEAGATNQPPRVIAHQLAAAAPVFADEPPYGHGPYLTRRRPMGPDRRHPEPAVPAAASPKAPATPAAAQSFVIR